MYIFIRRLEKTVAKNFCAPGVRQAVSIGTFFEAGTYENAALDSNSARKNVS